MTKPLMLFVAVSLLLLKLATWVGAFYVVTHFVIKFW
jgi:hypothetical protein